jgi:hypothetical protein
LVISSSLLFASPAFTTPPAGRCFLVETRDATMSDAPLRGDCGRCAALCCVAHAFDRSPAFAFTKPAGVPCRNLTAAHDCAIHARLSEAGFNGCARYDCYGAGQVVTQVMFGGRSWREDPALLPPMMDAFLSLRRMHELQALLEALGRFDLTQSERVQAEAHGRALDAVERTPAGLAEFDGSGLEAEIRAFLKMLRPAAIAASA